MQSGGKQRVYMYWRCRPVDNSMPDSVVVLLGLVESVEKNAALNIFKTGLLGLSICRDREMHVAWRAGPQTWSAEVKALHESSTTMVRWTPDGLARVGMALDLLCK